MKVRDIMEPNVVTVPSSATYEEAASVFTKHKISGAPVVNQAGEVVGVVSEKDLFRILFPFYKSYYEHPEDYTDQESREEKINDVRQKPVSGFMSTKVVTIGPDAPVMRAGAIMIAKGVHRLPVIENGKLIGIITRSRIYQAVVQERLNGQS